MRSYVRTYWRWRLGGQEPWERREWSALHPDSGLGHVFGHDQSITKVVVTYEDGAEHEWRRRR